MQPAMPEVNRLLVLAGAAVADMGELPEEVRTLLAGAEQVFVVTPPLPSKLQWLMSDTDTATHKADKRLEKILAQLRSEDVRAEGAVGDDTPTQIVDDYARLYSPDHVVIALRTDEHADWQERGLIEGISDNTDVPLTVFEIDAEGRAHQRS
jgi:GABA permease